MNFKQELKQLSLFLHESRGIWEQEVLNSYPDTLEHYPDEWSQYLSTLTDLEQLDFECRHFDKLVLPKGMISFFNELKELEMIPHMETSLKDQTYPSWAFIGVTGKKQHEISKIATLIENHYTDQNKTQNIIDIGGGVGHLARILALYHGKKVTTLDRDSELQNKGKLRLKKFPHPENAGTLDFSCFEFGKSNTKLKSLFNNNQLAIGLHTCGPLAINHFELALDNPHLSVVNFGCCYQKLTPSKDVPISNYGHSLNLNLTKHSLTLATRGHHHITEDEFKLKKKVKLYRAALHFLLKEKFGLHEFITLGSSFPRVYRENFCVYANEKLTKLGLKSLDDNELNIYYQSSLVQSKIYEVYYRNMMRWHFARVIEKAIILDRAIWLEEQGKKVEMLQVFDSTLSPRNIALIIN